MKKKKVLSFCSPQQEKKPIFFNHIPKTGGTSLTGVLFSIAYFFERPYQSVPKRYGGGKHELPQRIKNRQDMVITSESPYGFHKKFNNVFNLITVVRHPVERIVSHYFWLYRHHDRRSEISHADFENFLRSGHVNDLCTLYICGENKSDLSYLQSQWECNLQHYFAYCATESLDKMASWLLTNYQSASVVYKDAKQETDERQHEYAQKFHDRIIDYNRLDYALYTYVRMNEKEFFLGDRDIGTPHPETIIISNHGGKSFTFCMK